MVEVVEQAGGAAGAAVVAGGVFLGSGSEEDGGVVRPGGRSPGAAADGRGVDVVDAFDLQAGQQGTDLGRQVSDGGGAAGVDGASTAQACAEFEEVLGVGEAEPGQEGGVEVGRSDSAYPGPGCGGADGGPGLVDDLHVHGEQRQGGPGGALAGEDERVTVTQGLPVPLGAAGHADGVRVGGQGLLGPAAEGFGARRQAGAHVGAEVVLSHGVVVDGLAAHTGPQVGQERADPGPVHGGFPAQRGSAHPGAFGRRRPRLGDGSCRRGLLVVLQ